MKLPKQWKYWCIKAGLRPTSRNKRSRFCWLYLKGHNYLWRVSMDSVFQRSCPIEEFDRWANSVDYEAAMPTTEKEFVVLVEEFANKD